MEPQAEVIRCTRGGYQKPVHTAAKLMASNKKGQRIQSGHGGERRATGKVKAPHRLGVPNSRDSALYRRDVASLTQPGCGLSPSLAGTCSPAPPCCGASDGQPNGSLRVLLLIFAAMQTVSSSMIKTHANKVVSLSFGCIWAKVSVSLRVVGVL